MSEWQKYNQNNIKFEHLKKNETFCFSIYITMMICVHDTEIKNMH